LPIERFVKRLCTLRLQSLNMFAEKLLWNVTDHTSSDPGDYQLNVGNHICMRLHFDSATETVTLFRKDSRRTFNIERKGFLKSKFTINNEYGVKIGNWLFDKTNHRSADIELYEEKFRCELISEITGEFRLTLLANNKSASFELPVSEAHYAGIQGNELSRLSPKQLSFIVAVCWHLQKSVKEQVKVS
jgi:hypothetical protein